MASSGTIGKFNTGGNDYLVASTAFATCSTAANIAAKVATIQDGAGFTLIDGITVHVYFENTNTANNATLNVNNTGAKRIFFGLTWDSQASVGVTPADSWVYGAVVSLTYYSHIDEFSNNFEGWFINSIAPAIFPVIVTITNEAMTTGTANKTAFNILMAISNGQVPIALISVSGTYLCCNLVYAGYPMGANVAVFGYQCNSASILTHLGFHQATIVIDNDGAATIEWTNFIQDVTVNGSSVVANTVSGKTVASITAVTDVTVNGTSVVSSGTASITVPTVSNTYNGSSTDAMSGIAVAEAIGTVSGVTDVQVDGTSVVDSDGVAEIPTEVYNAETSTDYGYSIQQAFDAGKIVYYDITSNNISSFTCYRNGTQVSTNLYDFYGRYILTQASNDYTDGEGSASGTFYFTRTDNNASPDTVPYQFTMYLFDDYGAWNTQEIYKVSSVRDVTVNGVSVLSDGSALITGDLTDTKNTAGSTDTSSKIYLVGATSQAANPQTYSDNQVYATNGQLDANKVRVAETATIQWNSTDSSLDFVFA